MYVSFILLAEMKGRQTGGKRGEEGGRETDRQTDRQIDRQTEGRLGASGWSKFRRVQVGFGCIGTSVRDNVA